MLSAGGRDIDRVQLETLTSVKLTIVSKVITKSGERPVIRRRRSRSGRSPLAGVGRVKIHMVKVSKTFDEYPEVFFKRVSMGSNSVADPSPA